MSEQQHLLADTTERLFSDLEAAGASSFEHVWPHVEELQLASMLLREEDGGFGGDWEDFFVVARLAGFYGVAAPIGEATIARYFSQLSAWPSLEGLTVITPNLSGTLDAQGKFSGEAVQVPWGRYCVAVLGEVAGKIVRLRVSHAEMVEERSNPAGEARDMIKFKTAPAEFGEAGPNTSELGALLRTAQIAGALDRTLALSIEHANDRQQFGRPIAKFQAVQQNLAVLAEEAAAANSAGRAAALAAMRLDDARFEIAAAKVRANMAVGIGTTIGHQTHGAIGFTKEHRLQHFTRRLTSWRSEFGGDATLTERLGDEVLRLGADNLWAHLTKRSDRIGDTCNKQ